MAAQWMPAVVAILICAVIVWLIRHDHLAGRLAIGWLALAIVIAVLGLFPELANRLAQKLGIDEAPALMVAAGVAIVLIKLLRIDMERSKNRQQIRVLTQKIAILEARDRSRDVEHPDKSV